MEISVNEQIFQQDWESYKSKLNSLKELTDNELPRYLRLFDIRFRLALSLQISFNQTISYTNTETTRKTYKLILKLNDLWFAYEGLYKLCAEDAFLKSNPTRSDPFTTEKVTSLSLEDRVTNFGEYLNQNIYSNVRLKNDFINYLQYLVDNSSGKTQPRLLGKFKNKANTNVFPTFNQILSLIYGIRNMYVHNADTAKSGVNQYRTKIEALKNCNDFLTLSILRISISILNTRIDNIVE